MEEILKKLLMPDNESIRKGTDELREAFKRPESIPELCTILTTSQTVQIRQYGALLLRKKFSRAKTWFKYAENERNTIKTGILRALVDEPEKTVKNSIAQLIGVLATHELPKGTWPELLEFLDSSLRGENVLLGLYTLSVLADLAGAELKAYISSFVPIFNAALQNESDPEIGFYAIRSITHLIVFIGSDELNAFQPLIGLVVAYIRKIVGVDDEKAVVAMEIFDELFESEVSVVVPHIKPIIELCLKISSEANLDDALRVKAIAFLGRLTRLKKKAVIKHKLYIPMINTLFPIICQMEDEELEEDEDKETDESTPPVCASQTLDVLAVNLPPQKFMAALLVHVKPALESPDPKLQRGAFTAIAISAEGCSEHIRSNYLMSFLQSIGSGIRNQQSPVVKNAAFYALGQLSEYLQPEISNYSGEIFPVLFEVLDSTIIAVQQERKPEPRGLDRVFFALEIFSENLEEKLLPFLPELMKRLLVMVGDDFAIRTKEIVISAIGAAANAVKEEIAPYFEQIMTPLKKYLAFDHDDSTQILLTQSMYTLGVLAKAVGPTSFGPTLAEECVKLGLDLVTKHNDPDVRKCAYSLFAAVAFVVKEEMAAVLPNTTELMLTSLKSEEGITFEYKDEDPIIEELDEEDDDDEDEISLGSEDTDKVMEKVKSINVENSYMEEKEQTILAFKEMCQYTGAAFTPYLPKVTEEIYKLLDFPDEDIRKASVGAVAQLAIAKIKYEGSCGPEIMATLVPKLCELICTDEEVDVVCACLEALAELLQKCKSLVIADSRHTELIVTCVRNVMNQSEINCIDTTKEINGDVEDDDDDDDETEQDEMLFEYAGEVLPCLGKAMDPASFSPYFAGLFSLFMKKTKKRCTVAEKSFAVGSLAECMEPMKGVLDPYISHLFPTYLRLMKDEDEDVRNNAVYGLGEMALHGGPSTYGLFPEILQTLSNLMTTEKSPRVIDQIVGAVCRLIIANKDLVPVEEVLPVIINNLPLKEDHDEYEMVYRSFLSLYTSGHPLVKANLPKMIEVATFIQAKKVTDMEKIQPIVLEFLRCSARDLPEEFKNAVSALNPESAKLVMSWIS